MTDSSPAMNCAASEQVRTPSVVPGAQASHRAVQQVERLLVRRQRRGPLGRGRGGVRGFAKLPGRLVVRRPVGIAAQVQTMAGHLRDPRMQRPTPGQRCVALDGVTDEGVPEAEPPRRLMRT